MFPVRRATTAATPAVTDRGFTSPGRMGPQREQYREHQRGEYPRRNESERTVDGRRELVDPRVEVDERASHDGDPDPPRLREGVCGDAHGGYRGEQWTDRLDAVADVRPDSHGAV